MEYMVGVVKNNPLTYSLKSVFHLSVLLSITLILKASYDLHVSPSKKNMLVH